MLEFEVKPLEGGNEAIAAIAKAAGVGVLPAQVLLRRGIDTPEKAQAFMQGGAFYDPYALEGMQEAVELIRQYIEEQIPITVYGDYDCDGVCATTILLTHLHKAGAEVSRYIPSRQNEGYGLNHAAVEQIAQESGLLITVDCGVTNLEEVAYAVELGLDVIVTDHHQKLETLPPCIVLNATISQSYPFHALCGAGMAWKLVCALFGQEEAMQSIDLAAIATVADIVPLLDENRTIVKRGLFAIAQKARPGVKALMDVSGVGDKPLTAGQIAFGLGPRINAAGRMGDAGRAVELLMAQDVQQAQQLAQELDAENARRQQMEQQLLEQARAQLLQKPAQLHTAVAAAKGWHSGIAGIVASRIVELFGKPSAVICIDEEGVCTGSARGIPGVHIFHALDSCSKWLLRYGGHEQAGGFSLMEENLPAFLDDFEAFFASAYPPQTWIKRVACDLTVDPIDVSLSLAKDLEQLAPFGMGNPTPVVLLEGVTLAAQAAMGKAREHARLTFEKQQHQCQTLLFRAAARDVPLTGTLCDSVGVVERDSYQGVERVKCILKELRVNTKGAMQTPQERLGAFGYCFARMCKIAPGYVRMDWAEITQRLKQNAFGTAVLAQTPQGAARILRAAQTDGSMAFWDLHMGTVQPNCHRRNILLMAPARAVTVDYTQIVWADTHAERTAYAKSLVLTREQMGAVYRAFLQMGARPMEMEQRCRQASQSSGCTREQAGAALAVFLELGFFKLQSLALLPQHSEGKKLLTQSQIYQTIKRIAGGEDVGI